MILMLIAIVLLIALGMILADKNSEALAVTGILSVIVGICGLIAYIILIFSWQAAGVKADLINEEYGTTYTQEQIFYASDVIDTIRKIKRTRIEVEVK